jgi:hypothetical protein
MSLRRGSGNAAIQSSASDIDPSSVAVIPIAVIPDDSATGPIAVRMAGTTGTFGWLRRTGGDSRLPGMALASIQVSAEASAYAADGYLLEIYQQVAETTRPVATPRYARLAAFLAFVGLVTVALAVMISLPEDGAGPVIPQLCMALGAIGLLVSVAFSAQEARFVRASGPQTDADAYTTSSIYHASAGFFAVIVLISAALLFVR